MAHNPISRIGLKPSEFKALPAVKALPRGTATHRFIMMMKDFERREQTGATFTGREWDLLVELKKELLK